MAPSVEPSAAAQPTGGASPNKECRRIISAFTNDILPKSVYGESNMNMPAAVMVDNSKGACDTTTRKPKTTAPAANM